MFRQILAVLGVTACLVFASQEACAATMVMGSMSDVVIMPDGFVFSHETQRNENGQYFFSASIGMPDGTVSSVSSFLHPNWQPKGEDDTCILSAVFNGTKGSVVDIGEHSDLVTITRDGELTRSTVGIMTVLPNTSEWPNPLLSYGDMSFSSSLFVPSWVVVDYEDTTTSFYATVDWYGKSVSAPISFSLASASVSVPEPATISLIAVGALGLMTRPSKRRAS